MRASLRLAITSVVFATIPRCGHTVAQKKTSPFSANKVGVTTRTFHPAAKRNWRGDTHQELRVIIWYPAIDTAAETLQFVGAPNQPLFEAGTASPHAEFAPALGGWPLVVLSHGSGGSAIQMAWLGTALARAGLIAVAVDHPGNNSVDGNTPAGAALWWERATDISNVIDAMLADDEFGSKIDKRAIAAAGYSLGGYTMLELAGARTDISLYFEKCKTNDDSPVCHPRELKGLGTPEDILALVRRTSGESLARSGESFRDPRIKSVFAIAPALGFVLTPESLRSIRIPVGMVVGDEDRTAPAKDNADLIRMDDRSARETILPGVTHYAFLDLCTAIGKQALPQYCDDPPAMDRASTHTQVSDMAVRFFYQTLKLK